MKRTMVNIFAFCALLGGVAGTLTYPDCVNGPSVLTRNLVCNTEASPADRAAAIIAAFNISEKLVNLVDQSLGAPRLGLAPYEWWSEALHGVALSPGVNFAYDGGNYSSATSFPNPITMSAAFDDDLIESVADIISTEARAFSNAGKAGLDFWTPNINPYKDPRWGRGAETPGEDPFRIKGYVGSLLRGLEGTDKFKKVIATCKHFAAYDLEKWNGVTRYDFNAIVSLQDLSEYYLPPFQQCARDSKVGSIMCSYNSVNGTPSCANTYLMQTILREHWGWTDANQYITSDCEAVQNFYRNHNFTTTAARSAGLAYTAGTDTVCEAGHKTDVIGAYNQSLLTEATIDQALRRQYEGLVRAGYFDPANATVYRSYDWSNVNTPEAQALALQAAADGLVLKKNDGLLPLNTTNKPSLALIGFWANATRDMVGNYAGIPPYYHSPLYAALKLGFNVTYATGPVSATSSTTDTWTESAIAAANAADIVLYFGGNNLSIEAEELDRYNITLPEAQQDLVSKICSLGKPCVIVELGDQNDASPYLNNKNISAILWTGFPGQDGGTAVFSILTGETPPAGRLPVTMYPANYVNQVPMTDMSLRPSASSPGRTYKWYNESVLPFGYGLHYTTFNATFSFTYSKPTTTYAISDLIASCPTYSNAKTKTNPTSNTTQSSPLDLCPFSIIPILVSNTGPIAHDFVALMFLTGTFGPLPHPIKELVAYSRIRGINGGEYRHTGFQLTLGNLARVNERGDLVLYPGKYELLLDVPTSDTFAFELTGDEVVLDKFPQPGE